MSKKRVLLKKMMLVVVVLMTITILSGCNDKKGRGDSDVLRAEEVLDSAQLARRQDSLQGLLISLLQLLYISRACLFPIHLPK